MHHCQPQVRSKSMFEIDQIVDPNLDTFFDAILKHLGTLWEPQSGPKIAPRAAWISNDALLHYGGILSSSA